MKKQSQDFLKNFIRPFLKLYNEVTSHMDFGSSFHALAPRNLKDRRPVARRHLTKSKSLQFLVGPLWIWERCLNLCDKCSGAPSFKHLCIMTQSLNLSFWLMSNHSNDFSPTEIWSYFFRPRTILAAKLWRSCNFLIFLFEVMLHREEQLNRLLKTKGWIKSRIVFLSSRYD